MGVGGGGGFWGEGLAVDVVVDDTWNAADGAGERGDSERVGFAVNEAVAFRERRDDEEMAFCEETRDFFAMVLQAFAEEALAADKGGDFPIRERIAADDGEFGGKAGTVEFL